MRHRPVQGALRVEVVEQRVRLEATGIDPQRADDLEEVRDEHERQAQPEGRRQPIERDRRRQGERAEGGEHHDAVEPHDRQPLRLDVRQRTRGGEPDDGAEDLGRHRHGHEQDRRHEQRDVQPAARHRPGEEDLERPALALAGDRVHREAQREDEPEGDRDGVDEPERDRAGQA